MGVLLMLLTLGGSLSAVVLLVISYMTGSRWLRNFVLGSVAIWFGFYFLMLMAFSLSSTEKTLAIGEPKEYCGFYLDCHMHTSVAAVRTAHSIGPQTANGEFYVVTVKVFSDARRATLGLIAADAEVVDADGNRYRRDLSAEAELPPQPPFERQVSPSESFEKEIVFDLPVGVRDPRLDIREGYGIDHAIEALLVGDEDSILHKRSFFLLSGQTRTAGIN